MTNSNSVVKTTTNATTTTKATSKKVIVSGSTGKGHNRVVGSERTKFLANLNKFTSAAPMPLNTISSAKTAVLKTDKSGKCTAFGHTDTGYGTSLIDHYLLEIISGKVEVVSAKALIIKVATSPVVFSKCRDCKKGAVVATYDKVISHLGFANPKKVWLNKTYNRNTYSSVELNKIAEAMQPLCTALVDNLKIARKAYMITQKAAK